MLTSYALMLRKLELEKEKSGELDAYCVHEQKLLLMAVTSVSYTHLDVYKRQEHI